MALLTAAAAATIAIVWVLSSLATQSTNEQLRFQIQSYVDFKGQIEDRNEMLSLLAMRGRERIVWAEKIADVLEQMPADANMEVIDVDRGGARLTIVGRAPLRSAVVVFEENLGRLPWVESIQAPRDNLLNPVNPQFKFTLNIKRDG